MTNGSMSERIDLDELTQRIDDERPVAVEAASGRYYARWIAGGESFAARCNCGWGGPERSRVALAAMDLDQHRAH